MILIWQVPSECCPSNLVVLGTTEYHVMAGMKKVYSDLIIINLYVTGVEGV